MSRRQLALLILINATVSLVISLGVVAVALNRFESRLPEYKPLVLPATSPLPAARSGDFVYVVQPGDSLSSIAIRFDVPLVDLMRANSLTNPDIISAGQPLIIPSGPVPEPASPTATFTPMPFDAPTAVIANTTETTTPSPESLPSSSGTETAPFEVSFDWQDSIEILITGAGDIELESVIIVNRGDDPLDLDGWEISDGAGNDYLIESFRLEPGNTFQIYTGQGEDSPSRRHWGIGAALWNEGKTVYLKDHDSEVIAEFRIE